MLHHLTQACFNKLSRISTSLCDLSSLILIVTWMVSSRSRGGMSIASTQTISTMSGSCVSCQVMHLYALPSAKRDRSVVPLGNRVFAGFRSGIHRYGKRFLAHWQGSIPFDRERWYH